MRRQSFTMLNPCYVQRDSVISLRLEPEKPYQYNGKLLLISQAHERLLKLHEHRSSNDAFINFSLDSKNCDVRYHCNKKSSNLKYSFFKLQ